jgi:hypothetical protein
MLMSAGDTDGQFLAARLGYRRPFDLYRELRDAGRGDLADRLAANTMARVKQENGERRRREAGR